MESVNKTLNLETKKSDLILSVCEKSKYLVTRRKPITAKQEYITKDFFNKNVAAP